MTPYTCPSSNSKREFPRVRVASTGMTIWTPRSGSTNSKETSPLTKVWYGCLALDSPEISQRPSISWRCIRTENPKLSAETRPISQIRRDSGQRGCYWILYLQEYPLVCPMNYSEIQWTVADPEGGAAGAAPPPPNIWWTVFFVPFLYQNALIKIRLKLIARESIKNPESFQGP